MNLPQPPEGVLDPKIPWYSAKVGERTWMLLKARLTGRKMDDGTQYSSFVNLSEADADRLIENLKKDPRGYPQFNNTGGAKEYENLQKYQEWLVEEYLEKPFREETNKKIEDAEIERTIQQRKEAKKNEPKKEEEPKQEEQDDEQQEQETIDEVEELIPESEPQPEEQPEEEKKPEAKEEEESSNDLDSLKASLENIKGSIATQVKVAEASDNTYGNILANLNSIKQVFASQLQATQEQIQQQKEAATEKSLEQTNVSGGSDKAESTVKETDNSGPLGFVKNFLGKGKGLLGKISLPKFGGPKKMAGGGFLNTPFPATNALGDGGISMYPATGLPGTVSYAQGVIQPGLYDKPTRGRLMPGQAVIPLNRNYGKKILGDKPDKKIEKLHQPFAEVMQQPFKAIGSAIVALAGQFIRALGPVAGFFAPYINGIVGAMARVLDVPVGVINALLGGPAYAAATDAERQKDIFSDIWKNLMSLFGIKIGDDSEKETKEKRTNEDDNIDAIKFEGSENAEKTWNFLKSQGFDENQTAGIMGNLTQESGFNPKISNAYGYHGLMQWDPDTRWPRVSKYIQSIKKDPNSIEGQLLGLKWETDKYYKSSIDKIKNAKSIQEASDIWLKEIEVPGDYGIESPHRASLAKGIYNKYSKVSAEIGMNNSQGKPVDSFTLTGPNSGYPVPGIGTMHGKEAVVQYEKGFTILPIENRKFSMENDPLKTISRWQQILNSNTSVKKGYETGGRGLSTRGVQAGFTGMNKEGFDAIMGGDKFRLGRFKPQILGRGAYSAPTMKGAQRYAGTSGSLGGRQTAGGVVKSIVPGGARRINFLEPQAAVAPGTFDKGKLLADKLLSGKYANSPLANKLRAQLISETARSAGSFSKIAGGLLRLGGKALEIGNLPLVGDMLFPEGTADYDQISGPNSYKNSPGYKNPPVKTLNKKSNTNIQYLPVASQPSISQQAPQHTSPDKFIRTNTLRHSQIVDRVNALRIP